MSKLTHNLTLEYLETYRTLLLEQTASVSGTLEFEMHRDDYSLFIFWESFHDMVDAIPKHKLHIPILDR